MALVKKSPWVAGIEPAKEDGHVYSYSTWQRKIFLIKQGIHQPYGNHHSLLSNSNETLYQSFLKCKAAK
jgi:hypothetical protein